MYLASTTSGWHLLSDGKWLRVAQNPDGSQLQDLQKIMIDSYRVQS